MAATTAPTTDPGALDRFLEKVEAAEAMPCAADSLPC